MSNIFEGTGVKRYALRYHESHFSPWEYITALEYDTLTEAKTALKGMEISGRYEIVEKFPTLRYIPGRASEDKLVVNLLAASGLKPYILQAQPVPGKWENCYDCQYGTLEEARIAAGRTYRVAGAVFDCFRYEPVEVSG